MELTNFAIKDLEIKLKAMLVRESTLRLLAIGALSLAGSVVTVNLSPVDVGQSWLHANTTSSHQVMLLNGLRNDAGLGPAPAMESELQAAVL